MSSIGTQWGGGMGSETQKHRHVKDVFSASQGLMTLAPVKKIGKSWHIVLPLYWVEVHLDSEDPWVEFNMEEKVITLKPAPGDLMEQDA